MLATDDEQYELGVSCVLQTKEEAKPSTTRSRAFTICSPSGTSSRCARPVCECWLLLPASESSKSVMAQATASLNWLAPWSLTEKSQNT